VTVWRAKRDKDLEKNLRFETPVQGRGGELNVSSLPPFLTFDRDEKQLSTSLTFLYYSKYHSR